MPTELCAPQFQKKREKSSLAKLEFLCADGNGQATYMYRWEVDQL